jgi:putative sigma-54 modulation protein
MLVTFHGDNVLGGSELFEYIRRRLNFALAKFGDRIQRVKVAIKDTNGPRGGVDKQCLMVARLKSIRQTVVVQGFDSNVETLIDRSADRLGQTISRQLERHRMSRSNPHLN